MALHGKTFAEALRASWQEASVKERHFITPLSLYAKRSAPAWEQKGSAGKGEGGAKGGARRGPKVRSEGKAKKGASNTPEGNPSASDTIPGQVARKCLFWHVCGKCFQEHPIYACPKKAGQGDTGPESQLKPVKADSQ